VVFGEGKMHGQLVSHGQCNAFSQVFFFDGSKGETENKEVMLIVT
jgi:hypothetical protein